eukprot:s653_g6.t1
MPQTVWACGLCTLENPPSEDSCDACGHPRPAAGSGSVNAGFGTTWSEAAAQTRSYGRAAALEELRCALRGKEMPVTDDSETLGYVNTCLAAAIYVFRSSVLRKDVAGPQQFSEAIHSLAMAAGDADTNGAVAGALLGCALGRKALPELWLSQLPHRVWLEKTAETLACVATESGQAVPDQCLLRGSLPAAQWIPNDLLQEASGFSFVDKSAGTDTLHELGVREFGHEELVACIQYCNGRWLQSLWREQNRRSAAFNDLYKSLLDSILEDPARLSAVQNLSIFPVASTASKTLRGALFNEVDLCNSIGLHTAPCGTVSQSIQTHLVRCLEPSLEMSSQSLRLLQLLGVEPVSEAELEASAFRTLLQIRKPGEVQADAAKKARPEDTNFDHKSYWCAMTVLKNSYLKGRQPEAGWEALKGAANLLSHSQQLVPASRLRLWSFLGVELRLPPALISNICSIAGIEAEEAPSRHYVERAAAPSLDPSRESDVPSLESNLGWEVFMCNVFNCQPADPLSTSIGGPPLPEGFLESFLRLGEILTTGQFWQKAAGSPMTLDYLSRVMHLNRRSESAFARRNFLRKLSARSKAAPHGTMQDLFLQEVFQSLAGCYLPYISGVPSNPQVHALLRWCGVSTEIDEFSLLKALRFARETDIQDLGLVSEIYCRLYNCGFNPGEEKIFLVPGKGFVSKSECVWRPFKSELLRRCCQLEVLQDHYSRFGADVRTCGMMHATLRQSATFLRCNLDSKDLEGRLISKNMVVVSHRLLLPLVEADVSVNLEAYQSTRTALCTSWIRECPETSARALCESLIMAIECARVDTSRSRHLPGKPSIPPQEAAAKLFPASKAAIEDLVKLCVGTCLGMDLIPPEPSQRVEDKRPDGVVFNHFVQRRMIVVPGMGEGDVQCRILSMGEAYWDVVPELAGTPAQDVALKTHYGVGGNEEATVRFFTEVLHVKPFLTLDDWTVICQTTALHFVPNSDSNGTIEEGLKLFQVPSSGTVPWDIESVVDSVYEKLRHLPAPMEGPERTIPQSDSTPGRRSWRYVCLLGGGIPFFAANGAEPPPVTMSQQELMLVLSLCRHFGIHPRQIGFAYDPTGASVCRERLFLDIKYLQRARLLQSQAGYHAVVSFWAGKMARMLGNLGQVPSAGASAFRDHLLQEVLPAIFQADGDFH